MEVICVKPFWDIQRNAAVMVGDSFDTNRADDLISKGLCRMIADEPVMEEPVKRGRKKKTVE